MRTHGAPMTPEFAAEVRRLGKLGLYESQIASVLGVSRHRVAWARRKYGIPSVTGERQAARARAYVEQPKHHGSRVPNAPHSAAGPAVADWGPKYLEPEGLTIDWQFEDHPAAPAREPIWRPCTVVLP